MSGPARDPGVMVGRFLLNEKLGSGGMGEVYRATDPRLGRAIAIKLLPVQFAGEPDKLERFNREARAASALNHPNIITIYDAGLDNGIPWIAMELLEGRTLRAIIGDKQLSVENALAIAVQVAGALAKAHEADIVHRDLKPENVMVEAGGLVKVLDFGLAKLGDPADVVLQSNEETQLITVAGKVLGTPGYMSPEQVRGRQLDHRSDQFAFGVLLYEMITGANPFRRATAVQTMAAIVEFDPKQLRSSAEAVPAILSDAVSRCLAKDPAQRYGSTDELVAELKSAQGFSGRGTRQTGFSRRLVLGACAALLMIAVSLGALWRAKSTSTMPLPIIAVRPFKNLSANRDNDYVAVGIAEEIRAKLSQISAIRLLSRSAVERYSDGDAHKLADELGVTKVLEGTVRIDKDRLRIAVQLINAKTEQTLWSEQYDHALEDVLAAESDIASHIATAFTTAVTPRERRRIGKPVSQSPVAYDLYLQAKRLNSGNADTTARSIDLLKQAVDIDPQFAAAMAEIGYRSLYPRHIDEAYRWAQRAIDTDPELADGYIALAGANGDRGMSSKARAEYLKALELDPNRLQAMQSLVTAAVDLGQFEEALHWGRLALERNPSAPKTLALIAEPLLALEDFRDADRWLQVAQQRFPSFYLLPQMRVMEAITKQDTAQALQMARSLHAARPKLFEVQGLLADVALAAGAPDDEELNRGFYREALDQSFSNWLVLPESARVRFAYFAARRGDKTTARKWLDEAESLAIQEWKRGVESPLLPIEMAAIWAIRKDNDHAMEWMQRAYDRGWRIRSSTAVDPMLSNLRTDRRFQALIQRTKADLDRIGKESAEIRELFEKTLPSLPPAATK